jgi:hypothetical protein
MGTGAEGACPLFARPEICRSTSKMRQAGPGRARRPRSDPGQSLFWLHLPRPQHPRRPRQRQQKDGLPGQQGQVKQGRLACQ